MEDLCSTCLATGRNVRNLLDTEFVQVYSQLLNEISVYSPMVRIQVCWWCLAVLRRVQQFQLRARDSYRLLQEYARDIPLMSEEPPLQIHHEPPVSIQPEPKETDTLDFDVTVEVKVKEELDTTEHEHEEPETFVNDLPLPLPMKHELSDASMKLADGCQDRLDGESDGQKPASKTKKKDKKTPKTKKRVKYKEKNKRERKLRSKAKSPSLESDDFDKCDNIPLESVTEIDDVQTQRASETATDAAVELQQPCPVAAAPREVRKREVLPDKPTCQECGKIFSSKKTYRYHMNVLHKGNNQYPCNRCGKVFHWKSNLGRHMRSHKAADSDELHCKLCDKRFASIATYRQHLKISRRHVQEKDFGYQCDKCHKKFVHKTRLRDHIDWEHLHKIKFRCKLCGKPFKCHTSLYVHTQNVHRDRDRKDNLCHVCGKSYQNPAKLKYHIVAMHTSQTPYECKQCDAAFGWYSSLYRHVREVHYKMKVQPKKGKRAAAGELPPIPAAPPPPPPPPPPPLTAGGGEGEGAPAESLQHLSLTQLVDQAMRITQ